MELADPVSKTCFAEKSEIAGPAEAPWRRICFDLLAVFSIQNPSTPAQDAHLLLDSVYYCG
jgi:hypothetical protein